MGIMCNVLCVMCNVLCVMRTVVYITRARGVYTEKSIVYTPFFYIFEDILPEMVYITQMAGYI